MNNKENIEKDWRASRSFEKFLASKKRNIDFEAKRKKNIKILEEIIYDIENVENYYTNEKRRIIKEIEADNSIVDKNKAIDAKFEKLNDCIYADKKALNKKLKDTIKHQAKFLLIMDLDNPKALYDYYKMISTMPLKGDYAKLESDIYAFFIQDYPTIRDIISHYSELEGNSLSSNDEIIKEINELLDKAEKDLDNNALEEAWELIKTLPEGEEKDKLTKRAHDILEKIKANDTKLESARIAVEKAEKMGSKYPVEKDTKKVIQEAYDEVNSLDNCQAKASLLERLDKLVVSMTEKFMQELSRLQNKVFENDEAENDNSEIEDISEEEITNLRNLYVELYKDKIEELNFDKNGAFGYGKKLEELIDEYNVQAQDYYQVNKEFEKVGKKGTKIKLPFSLKQRLIEAKPHFIADVVKKGYKYKIERDYEKLGKYNSDDYKKANKDKKVAKYEKKYQKDLQAIREHDEISNVPLMMNRNKLEKLKETLYRQGTLGLDKKQRKKYDESVKGISKVLLKGLTKITKDKEVTSDPLRAKTVISQYLELLCVAPEKLNLKLKWNKRKKEVPVFEKTLEDAQKFVRDSYKEGAITKEDRDSYMFMMGCIKYYRQNNEYNIYEMFSGKDENGINIYTDIEGAKEYYKDPILFEYTDEENNKITEKMDYILPKRK